MFPEFLMTPQMRKMRDERIKQNVQRRLPLCVPWAPDIKWKRELNIQAKSYPILSLFKVKTTNCSDVNDCKLEETVLSPSKTFVYSEVRVPKGTIMSTVYGRERGDVLFDAPVIIPRLNERDLHSRSLWGRYPWMSLTPMELLTLRAGTKRAKGKVIVAGLGLGHQLIEVSRRKQVKSLTLVEQSEELVKWLYPRIEPHLGCKVKVVVGDAYQVLPRMKADVALVDIFKGYGSNHHERDQLRNSCFGIKFIWAWGASEVRDDSGW